MRRFFNWQRNSANTSAKSSSSARVRGGGRFRSLSFQALEPRDMKSADVAVALSSAGTTTPVDTTAASTAQAPAASIAGNSSTQSQFAMTAANSSSTQSRVAMIAANSSSTTATSPSATTAVASQAPAITANSGATANPSTRPSQAATAAASAGGTQAASTAQTTSRSGSAGQNAAQNGAGGLAASKSSYSDISNGYGGSSNGYGGGAGGSASPDDGYGGGGNDYGGSTTPSGPTITSFDATQDSSYWSLTGEVTDPNGLAGMSVTFGGLLNGRSTTVGVDGSFIYIKDFPAGTQGTVSAYVTDSQGAISNEVMVYIDG